MQVDAVFLDAGGVFVLPAPEAVLPLFERAGVRPSLERLHAGHYHAMRAWDTHERVDDDTWSSYLGTFARVAGVPSEALSGFVPRLRESWTDVPWSRVIEDSSAALRAITATGVRVAIVSNSDGTVEQILRAEAICQVGEGDGARVDAVVDSHVVGVAKPDRGIFEIALDAVDVRPERAVHVGDSVRADIHGARAAGIHPLHLDPHALCTDDDHRHIATLAELVDLLG